NGVPEMLAEHFSAAFPLSVFHADEGLGVHGARNASLTRSRCEIIAFLDDDIRVPSDWVETLASYYVDQSLGGVGGFVENPGNRRLVTRVLRPVLGLSSRRYRIDWGGFHVIPWSWHPDRDQDADWLSGGNMSCPRVWRAWALVPALSNPLGRVPRHSVVMASRSRSGRRLAVGGQHVVPPCRARGRS